MSNPSIHANITRRRYGGNDKDYEQYLAWHTFMDISKETESSQLHRAYTHHMIWVRRVMVPIFGDTYITSEGKTIDIKDCMEDTHIVQDFGGKYLPNVRDYVDLIDDSPDDEALFNEFHAANSTFYAKYPEVREFLLSPLGATGKVKSLLITCNSWMVTEILPRVFPGIDIQIRDFNITPKTLFARMNYASWIQNGAGSPPSYAKIMEWKDKKRVKAETKDMVVDGKNKDMRSAIVDGERAATGPGHDKESQLDDNLLPWRDTSEDVINLWGVNADALSNDKVTESNPVVPESLSGLHPSSYLNVTMDGHSLHSKPSELKD